MSKISRSPDPLSPPQPFSSPLKLVVYVVLALLPHTALSETFTMQEFMALQPKWEEWEKSETTLRVEGRFEGASSRLIRMRKCPLTFESAAGDFPRLGPGVERVVVTGRLDHHADGQFFRVFTVEKQPSDRETYAIKAAAVDPADAEDWHALAEWAGKLGGFYEDKFLLSKASEARRQGLAVERVAAAGDVDALTALAKRAEGFHEFNLAREIRHEALRLRWDKLREKPDFDARELAKAIRQSLPGSGQPIAETPMTLAAAYADQPVPTYNRAEVGEYNILDRLFLAEVLLADIERQAQENGSNGDAIAAKIESALPERVELAESYRLREIEYRLDNINAATRGEALALAKRLEDRGRADDARRALTRWLKVREAAAREDGPAGLVSVAEDYLAVLEDRRHAAELFIEAARANPESKEIDEKLRQLGYRHVDGQWLSEKELAARPVDPLTAAMREGRVTNGMNPEQVEKTLGEPDRIARAASRTRIHVVWVYGGGSGLAIHFARWTSTAPEEARVVDVTTWMGSR